MRNGRFLLLVDDDETTRDLLQLLLAGEGWVIETAQSGEEALRFVESAESEPDVILSDLQMPGLSGPSMAAALRAAASETAPLLIAMTATARDGVPEGFDDLLIKPFDAAELILRCEALWAGSAPAESAPPATDAGEPVLATDVFQRLYESMPPAQVRALYDFALQDAKTRVNRMAAAETVQDDEHYRREAHALKGSCGMIGALRLRSLAASAEDQGIPAATLIESNPLQQFHAEITRIRHMLESLLPQHDVATM